MAATEAQGMAAAVLDALVGPAPAERLGIGVWLDVAALPTFQQVV